MRKSHLCWSLVLAVVTSAAVAQERGLALRPDALGGATWQARFEHDAPNAVSTRSRLALGTSSAPAQTLRLLGDYQFSTLRLGGTGGLRLTGGLLINLRPTAGSTSVTDNTGALPYAGIGYSSGSLRGEWGFSADVGLAAPGLSSARIDRLFNNGSALGIDATPRLLPMIRLGVNVAF